jgi:malonyl CoA-acyl carrier protein transacylase
MSRLRALVLCPGRGSYGRDSLGSLQGLASPALERHAALRAAAGRPTVRELDGLSAFSLRSHVAGENASLLTAGASLADLDQLDPEKVEVVAVCGNSMGWYTALTYAGALPFDAGGRLIETLGQFQAGNVVGGQLVYPLVDLDTWRPDAARERLVAGLLDTIPELYRSILLGGQIVLGGTEAALSAAVAALPKVDIGAQQFPLRLPLHSAFHTPLLAATRARAEAELAGLRWRAPTLPLIDGAGRSWRPRFADPAALRDYTLGEQVVGPFDFSTMLRRALGDYGPDVILLPGPGSNLGGAVGQVLVSLGWAGLRDKDAFLERQRREPILISTRWPDQRALVVR